MKIVFVASEIRFCQRCSGCCPNSKSPGANIKEFLITILGEAQPLQIQCLSLKGEFLNEVAPERSFAVKQALEWSKSLFKERKGIWATARVDAPLLSLLSITQPFPHVLPKSSSHEIFLAVHTVGVLSSTLESGM